MIYLTGDTHGSIDICKLSSSRWVEGKNLSKNDYLIILGDFGIVWNYLQANKEEIYWLRWLDHKPWTTLFVDGNHECFPRLNEFPEVEMFGDYVGKINNSVYHLKRGKIYDIDGHTFFCMGGAESYDKPRRIEGVSWWPEEIPSNDEFTHGIVNLENRNWQVDYIFSHEGPKIAVEKILKKLNVYDYTEMKNNPLWRYFEYLLKNLEFKRWYFGHHHLNMELGEFYCLFDKIIKLEV